MNLSNYNDEKVLNKIRRYKNKEKEKIDIYDKIIYKEQCIKFDKLKILNNKTAIMIPANFHKSQEKNNSSLKYPVIADKCTLQDISFYTYESLPIKIGILFYESQVFFDIETIKNSFFESSIQEKKYKFLKQENIKIDNKNALYLSFREISELGNQYHILGLINLYKKFLCVHMNCDNCDSDFWGDIFLQIINSISFIEKEEEKG